MDTRTLGLALPLLAACGGSDTTETSDIEALEILDAHLHLTRSDDPETLAELVRDAGLAGALILGPADGSVMEDPDLTTWFAFMQVDEDGGPSLTQQAVDALEADLLAGARGIGELSIQHFASGGHDTVSLDPMDPTLEQVYDLCLDHGVPLNVHVDGEEAWKLEVVTGYDPDLQVVWAHAGDLSAEALRPYLEDWDNLRVDLAARNPVYQRHVSVEVQRLTDDDGLQPDWKELIEQHPDRFLWGSDVGPAGRDEQLDEVLADLELITADLDPEVAEAFVGGNLRELLGWPP